VIAYMPAVAVMAPTGRATPAHDRANLEASTPANWVGFPDDWLAKVHDKALRIFGDDEFRRCYWEESRKLRGVG
jgi:hypothetical protein